MNGGGCEKLSHEQLVERVLILERQQNVIVLVLESKFNESYASFEKRYRPTCGIQGNLQLSTTTFCSEKMDREEITVCEDPIACGGHCSDHTNARVLLLLPDEMEDHSYFKEVAFVTDQNGGNESAEVLTDSEVAMCSPKELSSEVVVNEEDSTDLIAQFPENNYEIRDDNEDVMQEEDCCLNEVESFTVDRPDSSEIFGNQLETAVNSCEPAEVEDRECEPSTEDTNEAVIQAETEVKEAESSKPKKTRKRRVVRRTKKGRKARKNTPALTTVENLIESETKIDNEDVEDPSSISDIERDAAIIISNVGVRGIRSRQPELEVNTSSIEVDNNNDGEKLQSESCLSQCSPVSGEVETNENSSKVCGVFQILSFGHKDAEEVPKIDDKDVSGRSDSGRCSPEIGEKEKRGENYDNYNDQCHEDDDEDDISTVVDEPTTVSLPLAEHSASAISAGVDAGDEDEILASSVGLSPFYEVDQMGSALNDPEATTTSDEETMSKSPGHERMTDLSLRKCDLTIFKCGTCAQAFTKRDERDQHALTHHCNSNEGVSSSRGVDQSRDHLNGEDLEPATASSTMKNSKHVRRSQWSQRRPAAKKGKPKGAKRRGRPRKRPLSESDTVEESDIVKIDASFFSTSTSEQMDDTPSSDNSAEIFDPKRKRQAKVSKRKASPQIGSSQCKKYVTMQPSDYLCLFEDCGYISPNRKDRRAHLKEHPMTLALQCPMCDKIYVEELNLEEHMQCHKPYVPPYDATGVSVRKSKLFQPRVIMEKLSEDESFCPGHPCKGNEP